jgi:hypothetical protein
VAQVAQWRKRPCAIFRSGANFDFTGTFITLSAEDPKARCRDYVES